MDQFSEDYTEILKYRKLDNLNPNRIQFARDVENEESESQEVSLVVLPFAPKNAWICKNKNNAQGELFPHRLAEIREKEPRRVWVYVPTAYNDNGHAYNLAILLDGFEFVEKLNAKNVLDNIISKGKLTRTICVFVDNKDRRYEELTCNDVFSDRIVEELMPWVRKNYNVSEDPDKVLIGGFSLSGLAAAYISMKHADVFGNVLCLSGSFWWDDEKVIKSYEQEPLLPLKFYLSVGLLEDEPYDTEPIMMKCVDKFCKTIQQKGNIVCYEKFHSGHDYLSWGESFGAGLISLFGNE